MQQNDATQSDTEQQNVITEVQQSDTECNIMKQELVSQPDCLNRPLPNHCARVVSNKDKYAAHRRKLMVPNKTDQRRIVICKDGILRLDKNEKKIAKLTPPPSKGQPEESGPS